VAEVTLASPHADAAVTAHLQPPSFEEVKAAITQAQATALAKPQLAGLDADVGLRGLDVVPLVSANGEAALRQLAVQSGQPLRLKLNGRARVSGAVRTQAEAGGATADAAGLPADGSWLFVGDLGLESLRVNQLKLFQKLGAQLTVSQAGVSIHGKGLRASETLDLDLALPLPFPTEQLQQTAQQQRKQQPQRHQQQQWKGKQAQQAQHSTGVQRAGGGSDDAQSLSPDVGSIPSAAVTDAPATAGHTMLLRPPPAEPSPLLGGGGSLQMRCGPLQLAANINGAASQVDFKVSRC
jgi:hypothetical protein